MKLRRNHLLSLTLAVILAAGSSHVGEALIPSIQLIQSQPWVTRNNTRETQCLAENIYHESRGESFEGKVAVAQVTLNRAAHKTLFKSTICGVVYQSKQFSWTIKPKTIKEKTAWEDSVKIAKAVMNGLRLKDFDAIYYHTHSVKPIWNRDKQIVKVIGSHIFYI